MCSSCEVSSASAGIGGDDSQEFVVTGMSCQSCAAKVDSAVQAVPGVTDVRVDVASGRITVSGPADANDIRAAVGDAGYEIANPRAQAR